MAISGTSTDNDNGGALPPWWRWVGALVLAAATLAAYHNTFSAPFIFDDIPAIVQNATIHDLRWSSDLLTPGALGGSGAAGRPLVNLSLALNRAIGGDDVRGYHVFNLLVHLAAGLALWGIVRRTLGRRIASLDAEAVAFCIALLWLLHPLQTESVTCVIQRTESLMGLFFLLTLYCFARSTDGHPLNDSRTSSWRGVWSGLAVLACALGAATKEVMVAAPVIVLIFDRTLVAGTFRDAWRRRWTVHAALFSTWLIVAALAWRSQSRGGTVGFGHGVAWWEYALTQCRALAMYLKLALWPRPLVLDYGTDVVRRASDVWPQMLLLVALMGTTAWALVRRTAREPAFASERGNRVERSNRAAESRFPRHLTWPVAGFLGAWFFVILAPSSSVVPLVTQTMAEHRMYLPVAAVVVGVALTLWAVAGRWSFVVCGVLAVALGVATERRNADYRTAESIWRDTAAKRPENARAQFALAQLAAAAGRRDEAIAYGEVALRLRPDDPAAHFNLAFDLEHAGPDHLAAAAEHYAEAARLRPEAADARVNLAAVFVRLGRIDEAIEQGETVVRLQPASGQDQFNLAQMLAFAGRLADALPHAEAAVRLLPQSADAHYRLGNLLVKLGRHADAVSAYRDAVRLAPAHFEAQMNLAGALLVAGRPAEAVPVYDAALRLKPDDPQVRANLNLARERAAH